MGIDIMELLVVGCWLFVLVLVLVLVIKNVEFKDNDFRIFFDCDYDYEHR